MSFGVVSMIISFPEESRTEDPCETKKECSVDPRRGSYAMLYAG